MAEVSVDTYLRGKKLTGYRKLEHGDLTLFISHSLWYWAKLVAIRAKKTLLWRSLEVEVEPLHPHEHSPVCAHR